MNVPKPADAAFLFLLIIIFSKLSYCIGNYNSVNFCPKIEKQSLLIFKQSLKDPSNKLSSWNINGEVNCCRWKGVVCNNYTGHVHQLHLHNYDLRGRLNPSLLDLKHLRYLDLSQNYFKETIPSFIGSFRRLEYLDLSDAEFYGIIPHTVGNLSNLRTLSMGYNELHVDSVEWLSGLSELEHLNMDHVNLSRGAMKWIQVINTLSSLVELSFMSCSLNFIGPIQNIVVNISSLAILDLSHNEFRSSVIPEWILQLSKLAYLYLNANGFGGPIPSISNATKLQHIDLSSNYLNSSIPDWLYLCKDLEYVSLYENSLHGTISNDIANLSSLNAIYLYRNKLSGNLPQSLGKLFHLEHLSIGQNMLEGEVNESHFVNLTKLKYLYLYQNHLSWKVNPNWIPPFKLVGLGLSGHLGVIDIQVTQWLDTQESVQALDLSSTGISGHIPYSFWEITLLNLSNNHLHGNIPDIIGPKDGVRIIYLSSNQFNGSLPRVADSVTELDLSNNSFSGGLSHFLCDMTNETYRLEILHLGENNLTGELPDCLMKWPSLKVLNLGNNNMHGSIPNSIGFLVNLESLNLYGNRFSGRLPFSMHSCGELRKIDLSHNHFDGNMPSRVWTSLTNLMILILRSNKLSGVISSEICHLNSLQILDLSNNKFSRAIPKCFNNFTAMAMKRSLSTFEYHYSYIPGNFMENAFVSTKGSEYNYDTILQLVTNINLSKNNFSGDIPEELTSLVELQSLNLSNNHLKGSIPDRIGDMKQLESLDFSRNFLSGEIPISFKVMSSLNHLNLSYNNLTGKIPASTQILGFDASNFMGNDLCGPPLTRDCSNDDEVLGAPGSDEDDEGNKSEIDWFYIFLSLGYAVGFSVVCTTLIFKKSWRDACFGFLEDLWNKVYVYANIKWRRFAERRVEAH